MRWRGRGVVTHPDMPSERKWSLQHFIHMAEWLRANLNNCSSSSSIPFIKSKCRVLGKLCNAIPVELTAMHAKGKSQICFIYLHMWPTMSKVGFCCQKSKLVLFFHEILCCKTFQMTYYLFMHDVPNRSCVTLKYSSVGNYFWRKTQSKFGKYASLATHTYSKTTRM